MRLHILTLSLVSLAMMSCQAPIMPFSASIQGQPQLHAQALNIQAVTTISVQEAQEWLADPKAMWLVLDIRTESEYQSGHLKDAQLMDFYQPDFREKLLNMNRHQPTIMYCRSGNRSAKALQMMRELGFRNVYEIRGGIQAWQNAGYPLQDLRF